MIETDGKLCLICRVLKPVLSIERQRVRCVALDAEQ